MTVNWRPVGLEVVLRSWAVAEATSQKEAGFSGEVARQAPALHGKLLRGEPLLEGELSMLARGIEQYRAPMLVGLLPLDPVWYEGTVSIGTLIQMRIFNLPDWIKRTPSRRLSDHCGDPPPRPSSAPEFRGFRSSIERPIAVAPHTDGPYCLLEGYTRSCAMIRDHKAGAFVADVPIYLGVTPRIEQWSNGQGWGWW